MILMYCSMAMTSGLLAHGELEFALTHAVNLAEAGISVSDKRIGTFTSLYRVFSKRSSKVICSARK